VIGSDRREDGVFKRLHSIQGALTLLLDPSTTMDPGEKAPPAGDGKGSQSKLGYRLVFEKSLLAEVRTHWRAAIGVEIVAIALD